MTGGGGRRRARNTNLAHIAPDAAMTTEHILGLLPNRYPFLLMARVLEISDDRVSGVDAE